MNNRQYKKYIKKFSLNVQKHNYSMAFCLHYEMPVNVRKWRAIQRGEYMYFRLNQLYWQNWRF